MKGIDLKIFWLILLISFFLGYKLLDVTFKAYSDISTFLSILVGFQITSLSIIFNSTYSYSSGSNMLIKVEDAPDQNPSLPDFKNNANIPIEYGYDNNGNLETDANKSINIPSQYNYLNKPSKINVQNKGIITYIYDASGNRLCKKIHYTDGSGNPDEKWDYIGNFVYKDNILQYIINDEGRIRPTFDPDDPYHPTKYIYDYFIKDHLGNVRSTITAQPINHDYMARHELSQANIEQLIFDNIPNVRGAKPGSTDPNDNMAARLNGADPATTVGTAIMLKTMPGDEFSISADAFYDGDYQQQSVLKAQDIISSLSGALLGGANYDGVPLSELPNNVKTIQTILGNPSLATQLDQLTNTINNPSAPKAHLNYLFFDDRMNFIGSISGSVQVNANTGGWGGVHPVTPRIGGGNVPSGYLIVYVDNQSIGKDVWFDNISIEHYTSKLLEEDHYYPYGLALQTTSDLPGLPKQPYKYQTIELEKHFGLETEESFYRNLDPQLGRFNSIDPKPSDNMSPYSAMSNNPALYSDPLGDTTQVYGKNGVLLGTVNDHLKNQVHYLSINGDKDATPWTLSDGKTVDANAWGETFRKMSTAFIGENSAKSLKEISDKSAAMSYNPAISGQEVGVYGEVSNTKEIIFKQINGVNGDFGEYPMDKGVAKAEQDGHPRASLYILGHTHVLGWNKQPGAPFKEYDRDYMLGNYGKPSGSPGVIDYRPLPGVTNSRVIGSPLGITIYSTEKYYDDKNNTKSYGWFKR